MPSLADAATAAGKVVDKVAKKAFKTAEELRKAMNELDERAKQATQSSQAAQDANDRTWGPLVNQSNGIIDMSGAMAKMGISLMQISQMTSSGPHGGDPLYFGGGTLGGGETGQTAPPPAPPPVQDPSNPADFFTPGSSG